jgi:hypothetical protein
MVQVERSGIVQELEMFRKTRREDYALLIAKEARVGDNVLLKPLTQ